MAPGMLVATALLAACSGSETQVHRLYPDIAVAPAALDFGDVVVLYSDEQVLQVVNAGRADLEVSEVAVEGDVSGAVFTAIPDSFTLGPDESTAVAVTFAPDNYLDYEAQLVLRSNDPDTPDYVVPLSGSGVDGPTPDIVVDPLSVDFGAVAAGETETLYFTITNAGDGELEIGSWDQSGSGAFTVLTPPDGQVLAPEGGLFTVLVEYAPTSDAGDSGTITIRSNDPDEPEVEVLLLGNGGGDYEYPVAVIDCPDTVDPPVVVTLDGSASYDPEGHAPLTYEWTLLDAPGGSSASIEDAGEDVTSVFADLAGDYEVELRVTNALGVQGAPARCTFTAEPSTALHVEMYWNTGGTDFDLHLIQDGYEFAETPGDCCWCNPNPDWGESGTADDPDLALDDRDGYGPENIRIDTPADGNYFVKVHYFQDNGGGTTTATVRIWIDGVLEDELSEVLTDQNQVWDVGYVRWPEGVFVEQANDLYRAAHRSCWSD